MVTIVPISDFIARRHLERSQDSYIYEKYEGLFKKYACFLEPYTPVYHTSLAAVPPHITPKTSGSFYGRKKQPKGTHHHQPQRRPICKDPARVITGYLNVINVENYSRVFMKIRLLLDHQNINSIVRDILQKCWTATIFINVYIKLLADISAIYNIYDTILECVVDNINRFEFKNNVPDSYDLFCEKQKHKMFVLGLNITLIKLSIAGLISQDVLKNYVRIFENRILTENDEYTMDIILHILLEICKSYRGIIECPKDLASRIKSDIPRIRFLIQELAESH